MPTILENLKVKQIIIGSQYENSSNYQEFIKLAKDKNIKVNILQNGQRINIENDIYIDILWPEQNQISENALNNNSLVCKLHYNSFEMLFTGDIEKIAEQKILTKIDNDLLVSDVLKVAHHGSKTSSIQEFIEKVQPKIALIGVGKDNKFGHPNEDVIKRLEHIGTKIYRTDENGEISIKVNKKGQIWINKMLN